MPSVRAAEEKLLQKNLDHEYLPIHGNNNFIEKSVNLAWGGETQVVKDGRIAGIQSLSGTGSLRLAFEFLKHFYHKSDAKVFIPSPSWPTHKTIQDRIGNETQSYRYYNPKTKSFDAAGMCEDLEKADNEQIIILHVCAHNPTGCDPSKDEWK